MICSGLMLLTVTVTVVHLQDLDFQKNKLLQSVSYENRKPHVFQCLKMKPDKARKARAKSFRCQRKLGLMHFKG